MFGMTTGDWIMIAAVVAGPILAVQAQRLLESIRDRRNRRMAVFHDLMATRAARVSHVHVQALNMIDIEFYGRRVFGMRFQTPSEKAVSNAWRVYSDHLNNRYADSEVARWGDDGDKLFAKLLFELSRALGYDFDEVQLRRNVYSPVAHGRIEQQDLAIRDGLEKLLTGRQPLPVSVFDPGTSSPPSSPEPPSLTSGAPPA